LAATLRHQNGAEIAIAATVSLSILGVGQLRHVKVTYIWNRSGI
jgi:hypothetical protein